MKRNLIPLLLVLTLLLSLVGCITLTPETDGTSAREEDTEASDTTAPPSIPSPPTAPEWLTPDIAASEFLLTPPQDAVVDASSAEYSYAELGEDLAQLAARYPAYLSYRSFGQSLDGKELYVATLGNPDAPRQLLFCAGIHGREYLTPLLAMLQLEFYLRYLEVGTEGDRTYADLLSNTCIYVVPMANPDGIMLSEEGISSLSKPALRDAVRAVYAADRDAGLTLQTDIDAYLRYWKANAAGTDLNRNFDALWQEYRPKIYQPSFAQYKGPSAASEPETRALVALTDSLPGLQAVIALHSQGEVIYWDCGQTGTLHERNAALASALAERTGYERIDEVNNDASYTDWCTLERGIPTVTLETGNGICPLEHAQLSRIWQDNFNLIPLCMILTEDWELK